MLALKLNNFNVKLARQQTPELEGKKPIARGMFSAIFDGSRPDTVYKLTVDKVGYWLLNCCSCGVEGVHFPKLIKNHHDICEVMIGGKHFPVYLYEIERLEKLGRSGSARTAAKTIATSFSRTPSYKDALEHRLANMSTTGLSESIRDAIANLREFTLNYETARSDMHMGNFMQRKNGELVITDPFFDDEVHEATFRRARNYFVV